SFTRDVDELSVSLHKQRFPVGKHTFRNEWVFRSELPTKEVDCLSHRGKADLVVAGDAAENVHLQEIPEGQQEFVGLRDLNNRRVRVSSEHPVSNGRNWEL